MAAVWLVSGIQFRSSAATDMDVFWYADFHGEGPFVRSTVSISLPSTNLACEIGQCASDDKQVHAFIQAIREQYEACKADDVERFKKTLVTDNIPSGARTPDELFEIYKGHWTGTEGLVLRSCARFGELLLARVVPKVNKEAELALAARIVDGNVKIDPLLLQMDAIVYAYAFSGLDAESAGRPTSPVGTETLYIPGPGADPAANPAKINFNVLPVGKGIRLTNQLESVSPPETGDKKLDEFLQWYGNFWADLIKLRQNLGDSGLAKEVADTYYGSHDRDMFHMNIKGNSNVDNFIRERGTDLWLRFIVDCGPIKFLALSNGNSQAIRFETIYYVEGRFEATYPFMDVSSRIISHEVFLNEIRKRCGLTPHQTEWLPGHTPILGTSAK